MALSLLAAPPLVSAQSVCSHPIYCTGDVLRTVQLAHLFADGKTFVDMPLRFSAASVLENFKRLPDTSAASLRQFLLQNFYNAHSEVAASVPTDWSETPAFLKGIADARVRDFAFGVHKVWKQLVRKFDHSWLCDDCYSSITSANPFVVAGGRFQEQYYWDNLWIVKGLLVSEMYQTAIYVAYNIVENIKQFGYMPNGGRLYYLNRSQPPMAALIINEIYQQLKDNDQYKQKLADLLAYSYPYLKQEYQFFQTRRAVNVTAPGRQDKQFQLNHYDCALRAPRPESYASDYELHLKNPDRDEQELYRNLGAAAESNARPAPPSSPAPPSFPASPSSPAPRSSPSSPAPRSLLPPCL